MTLQKNKPIRDREYLKLLDDEPCCCCYQWVTVDNRAVPRYPAGGIHHHYGKRGKGVGQKCDDRECVPICLKHHNEIHAKGPFEIEKKYCIDLYEVGLYYRNKHGRKFEYE